MFGFFGCKCILWMNEKKSFVLFDMEKSKQKSDFSSQNLIQSWRVLLWSNLRNASNVYLIPLGSYFMLFCMDESSGTGKKKTLSQSLLFCIWLSYPCHATITVSLSLLYNFIVKICIFITKLFKKKKKYGRTFNENDNFLSRQTLREGYIK